MSVQILEIAAGVVLSLVFSYTPGLKNKWNELEGDQKRIVMLLLLFVVSAGFLSAACLGRYEGLTCDVDGAWQALEIFVLTAIANQAAFALSPKVNR